MHPLVLLTLEDHTLLRDPIPCHLGHLHFVVHRSLTWGADMTPVLMTDDARDAGEPSHLQDYDREGIDPRYPYPEVVRMCGFPPQHPVIVGSSSHSSE